MTDTGKAAFQDVAAGAPEFCANLVRNHDFQRYAATLFVTPEQRRDLLALYAFNVEITRVRDLVSQALPGEIRLKWWIDALEGGGHGEVSGNPVAAELMRMVDQFQIDRAQLVRLIEEHQFDLYNDPMPDYAVLDAYLGKTDGTLFELSARILGHSSDEIDHLSHHAGIAFGIVRLVRALPVDAARRQLYLPQEWLGANSSSTAELFAGKSTPGIAGFVSDAIVEARRHLDHALAMLADAPSAIRPAFLPLAMTVFDIAALDRKERDPFSREQVSRLRILWTIWRASRRAPFRA